MEIVILCLVAIELIATQLAFAKAMGAFNTPQDNQPKWFVATLCLGTLMMLTGGIGSVLFSR